ncbi:MAG: DUF1569 domain-containing protein [Saprospiraceae bacterium]
MKNLINYTDREAILARIQTLTSQNTRKWGKLTIEEILPHMTDPFRAAMHEKTGTPQKSPLYNSMLGKAMRNFVPWPKAAPTDPSFLPGTGMTAPTSFEQDKQTLLLTIHRFANFDRPMAEHSVFGNMNHQAWGRLMWRHLDHHLRQFSA